MSKNNYGFIAPIIVPEDFKFGALGGEILNLEGDWRPYLPEFEHQRKAFDTMSCVTFGTLSAVEMIHKLKYRIEPNYSDRFISKVSETGSNGNTPKKVAQAIRHFGLVKEIDWAFPDDMTLSEYFKEIPTKILKLGLNWLTMWTFGFEYVHGGIEEIKEALKYSPLGASVYAWQENNKGEFIDGNPNHWIDIVFVDEFDRCIIWDSYEKRLKTLVRGYDFKFKMRYSLDKKDIQHSNWFFEKCRNIIKAIIDFFL